MNTYPVCLLISGRDCLIVGGGKVATRKAANLLQAGANVTIIAPEITAELTALASTGQILWQPRRYRHADLNGRFLVYAATDDAKLNQKITADAETLRILVCPVDANWHDGSFITPATLRHHEITIALSSGGTDCRKARMIRNSLTRHLNTIENTSLLVFGTDHRHLPAATRAKMHITGTALNRCGESVLQLHGIHEFMLINTCNRVELIAAAKTSTPLLRLIREILGFDQIEARQYYALEGYAAFRHLCLTNAGLLSQIAGETYITAQIKHATAHAIKHNWCKTMIPSVIADAAHVAKHIRTATAAMLNTVEIDEVAASKLDCVNKTVIIAGSGLIGTAMLQHVAKHARRVHWLYHRHRPENVAENITVSHLDRLEALIPEANIVVAALNSTKSVLNVNNAGLLKNGAVLVDLAVPPNFDPALMEARPDLTLLTLADFSRRPRKLILNRAIAAADSIIEEHRGLYDKFIATYLYRHP